MDPPGIHLRMLDGCQWTELSELQTFSYLNSSFFVVKADSFALVLQVHPRTWLMTEYEKKKHCSR